MVLSLSRAALVRIAPFGLFMALLALRGMLPDDGSAGMDPRWIYGLTVLAVGGLLMWFWREYGELTMQVLPDAKETLLAVAVGLAVFVMWIYLDAPWMKLGDATARFVPVGPQGELQWPLIAVRWIGAALIVPVMEELFWRSFLMRWIESPQFEGVPPQRVGLRAVVLSTFVFMLAHTTWLSAVVAGLAYAGLYLRTSKLWVPVLSHAVTNGALGIWVVAGRHWDFW